MISARPVLVTGGSGFIAGHCVLQLVAAGYRVRTTVRSLEREPQLRAQLAAAGLTDDHALELVEADLTDDRGWDAAVAGVDHVLHVASPVSPGHVADADAVIIPAREGALRVLRASRDAGVRRVVLTSAFHAVSWGHPHDDHVFTEQDWTVLDGPGVDAYARSKTLAERAAWDFVAAEDGAPELTTLLPVAVMGPVLGTDVSGSNHLVQMIMTRAMPGYPNLFVPVVDVRDVAAGHLVAMTAPAAVGRRYLLAGDPPMALREIGAVITEHFGPAAGRVPTRSIPDLVLRAAALFSPALRSTVHDLGYVKRFSTDQAVRDLGWRPRPSVDAVLAAAESLLAQGLVTGSAASAG